MSPLDADLEDVDGMLVMSYWDWHRSLISDDLDHTGRPKKIGVDKHAPSCADDEGRFKCECGLGTA